MKTIIQKAIWLGVLALAITACSKEENQAPEGTDECWYKVTIDGQTTHPNQFGQDIIGISTGAGNHASDPDDYYAYSFGFNIMQSKANASDGVSLIVGAEGAFNNELPAGNYPAIMLGGYDFHTPALSYWPMYLFMPEKNNLTYTVLENSDLRIHMKVSGTVTKLAEGMVEIGIVPIEAEIKVGRKNYYETVIANDVVGGSLICECQEQ